MAAVYGQQITLHIRDDGPNVVGTATGSVTLPTIASTLDPRSFDNYIRPSKGLLQAPRVTTSTTYNIYKMQIEPGSPNSGVWGSTSWQSLSSTTIGSGGDGLVIFTLTSLDFYSEKGVGAVHSPELDFTINSKSLADLGIPAGTTFQFRFLQDNSQKVCLCFGPTCGCPPPPASEPVIQVPAGESTTVTAAVNTPFQLSVEQTAGPTASFDWMVVSGPGACSFSPDASTTAATTAAECDTVGDYQIMVTATADPGKKRSSHTVTFGVGVTGLSATE